MQKSLLTILFLIATVTLLSYGLGSCRKNEQQNHLLDLQQVIPDNFPQPVYKFENNPLTRKGFELGRNYSMTGVFQLMVFIPVHHATSK